MPDKPLSRHPGLAAAAVVLVLAALAWLAWSRGDASSGRAPEHILRIASQKAGTKALLLASGELDHLPYRIEWSEFPSAAAILEALGADAADTGLVGDEPFLFAYANGTPVRAILALRATGPLAGTGTGIVVPTRSAIRAPAQLRGRRIGTVKGSSGHFTLLQILAAQGLHPSDVEIVYLSNGDARAALVSGAIDAWATWGTYLAKAVVEDGQHVVADGAGLRTGFAFQSASVAAIRSRHDLLEDFLRRIVRAYAWKARHPEAHIRVLAGETGLSPAVLRWMAARSVTDFVPISPAIAANEAGVARTFVAAGLLRQAPDLTGAFDTSFAVLPETGAGR